MSRNTSSGSVSTANSSDAGVGGNISEVVQSVEEPGKDQVGANLKTAFSRCSNIDNMTAMKIAIKLVI